MRISTNIKLLLFHATLRTRALPYFCAYFAFFLLNTRHYQIISIKFSMILLSFHIYNTSLYFSHIAIFYLKPSCSHYDCIKPILSKIKQILVESEKFYGQYLIPLFFRLLVCNCISPCNLPPYIDSVPPMKQQVTFSFFWLMSKLNPTLKPIKETSRFFTTPICCRQPRDNQVLWYRLFSLIENW